MRSAVGGVGFSDKLLVPCNWKGFERTEAQGWLVLQLLLLYRQMEGGEPLGQGLEGRLPLQPGQGSTQAVMDPGAKGHMGVGISGDVKLVGLRNLLGSRLAEAMTHLTRSSVRMTCALLSTSWVAMRWMDLTGGS